MPFHRLRVAAVDPLTDDSRTITLTVPDHLAAAYRFVPGQHLTLRVELGGRHIRRSYSICVPPSAGVLRVAVRTLPGGLFSEYVRDGLAPGDEVDVMTPVGRFGASLFNAPQAVSARGRQYAAIVAGSGITPVLSIATHILETDPAASVSLVYANRDSGSVMFADHLADVKDQHLGRLQVLHVLSREPRASDLLSGRIDRATLAVLFADVVRPATVDEWLLCGPYDLIQRVQAMLADHGVPPTQVHTELFYVDEPARVRAAGAAPRQLARTAAPPGARCQVTIRLDGRSSTFTMSNERSLLDATLAVRADAPYACRGGVCGTCRIRILDGAVTMDRTYALESDELDAGFALACQSVPTSAQLLADFDA
ncbi:MAG: 2Fe-2S iron-sulfur cluster-binding protein [Angustibacter sp.]